METVRDWRHQGDQGDMRKSRRLYKKQWGTGETRETKDTRAGRGKSRRLMETERDLGD